MFFLFRESKVRSNRAVRRGCGSLDGRAAGRRTPCLLMLGQEGLLLLEHVFDKALLYLAGHGGPLELLGGGFVVRLGCGEQLD